MRLNKTKARGARFQKLFAEFQSEAVDSLTDREKELLARLQKTPEAAEIFTTIDDDTCAKRFARRSVVSSAFASRARQSSY